MGVGIPGSCPIGYAIILSLRISEEEICIKNIFIEKFTLKNELTGRQIVFESPMF